MWKNKKAVLFDLDGTLVDSMWLWYDIDVEYLNRFNCAVPDDLQSAVEGMSFTETAYYFKKRFSIPDTIDQIKNDWTEMAWDRYEYKVPLKKGALKFIKACNRRGIKLGITSSNSADLIKNVLKARKITDYFDCVITCCEVAHGKPSPDIYIEAARRLNVLPGDCLVFEDIVSGIKAGIDAGMEVCAVEDEYSVFQRTEKKSLANYYIEDYEELLSD